MTGSASNAMDVLVACDSLCLRGGFQGGEGTRVGPDSRLADDGKRI